MQPQKETGPSSSSLRPMRRVAPGFNSFENSKSLKKLKILFWEFAVLNYGIVFLTTKTLRITILPNDFLGLGFVDDSARQAVQNVNVRKERPEVTPFFEI